MKIIAAAVGIIVVFLYSYSCWEYVNQQENVYCMLCKQQFYMFQAFCYSIMNRCQLLLRSYYGGFRYLKNNDLDLKRSSSPVDPSSFSRPDLCKVTKIALDLQVDFYRRILHGNATLNIQKADENVNEVILDAKDLNIFEIVDEKSNRQLDFIINDPVEYFGSKLIVKLPYDRTNRYVITVRYETSPKASGLLWLNPEQTTGKIHPFMFSQFQPIHARSALPCQDTPAVKTPYTARIKAPTEMTVLMSAMRTNNLKEAQTNHTYHNFIQKIPVPSYLIAIAVGALESRVVGRRSHVWAEKAIISDAAYEFATTETQLMAAEKICGPYVWGIYDILVLPPSFPYGGMENPCLTFMTPTILAGDRSLINIVAHEIAHSWTGNLVTNKNFEHFWLNEGFTVFIERKIKASLENEKVEDFDAYKGKHELEETVDLLGKNNPLTCLVVDLKEVHPDDSFSKIPYEKGYIFLRYLEEIVGGPKKFEPFLKDYFDTFKYKSIDTNDFKQYFTSYFAGNVNLRKIDWNTWLYKPGMPPVISTYDLTYINQSKNVMHEILDWNEPEVIKNLFEALTTGQKIYLLQEMIHAPKQNVEELKQIEHTCKMHQIKNAEIKFRWLRICIKAHWEEKIPEVLQWVNEIGRMKFVRPLYRDLYNWELARPLAIKNFRANQHKMMHVLAYTVAKDLHLQNVILSE